MPVSGNGSFNPQAAHTYTLDELMNFMRKEGLTIHQIHSVRKLNMLAFNDYERLLYNGFCTVDDLRACGVNADFLEKLEEKNVIYQITHDEWEAAKATRQVHLILEFLTDFPGSPFEEEAQEILEELQDHEDWQDAERRNVPKAYRDYLESHPHGRHVEEAHRHLGHLQQEEDYICNALIDDMILFPWKYPPSVMTALLTGNQAAMANPVIPHNDESLPPHERFLARGKSLDFELLKQRGVVPPGFTRDIVQRPEFSLPQTVDFDNFPLNRTDVFFLGVPRSGKSTVLSSLFYTMYRDGRWDHKININPATGVDPSQQYYEGLLRAVQAHKPPESTSTDTISYISMDVPAGPEKKNVAHLNFVEISGEAVEKLAQSISPGQSGTVIWSQLGASNVLANTNSKILFFLLDYNTIRFAEDTMAVLDQELTLSTALNVLVNDGYGKKPWETCTLSKVESVAILLTKADLMGTDDEEERQYVAMEYLKENFKGFMNTLAQYCQQFNINRYNGNRPLIYTFSAGQFYVGNTLEFDDTDARKLAERIESLAPYKNKKGKLF